MALAALAPLFLLAGCGPDNRRPTSAMPIQSAPVATKKPPSTVEEKIKAIESAPISQKEKDSAIARVRSGKL